MQNQHIPREALAVVTKQWSNVSDLVLSEQQTTSLKAVKCIVLNKYEFKEIVHINQRQKDMFMDYIDM